MPGHWEGDLIAGTKNSYIVTLVERKSRYVMMMKVANRDTQSVVAALIKHAHKLPGELYKSLTWDRGKQLSAHQRFTLATDVQVYFCDPRSPWQRGSNENTNRLLRQYLHKGTDLSVHSQEKLNAIARALNERPRKTLDYDTPAMRFNACVAITGEPTAQKRPLHPRQLEARWQAHSALHFLHLFVRHPVGFVARVVEGGGDEVFQHLLFGRDHQAVVDLDAEHPALGGAADFHDTAAGGALDLDFVQLDLHVVHLGLDCFGSFLCRLDHFFHRLHGGIPYALRLHGGA